MKPSPKATPLFRSLKNRGVGGWGVGWGGGKEEEIEDLKEGLFIGIPFVATGDMQQYHPLSPEETHVIASSVIAHDKRNHKAIYICKLQQ